MGTPFPMHLIVDSGNFLPDVLVSVDLHIPKSRRLPTLDTHITFFGGRMGHRLPENDLAAIFLQKLLSQDWRRG